MVRHPPTSTPTDTLFPYPSLLRSHVLFLCDVAPEICGLPARRSDDRLTGLVVDVRHRDVGTTGHQQFHGGAPDAAATTRHDYRLAAQIRHLSLQQFLIGVPV